MSMTAGFAEVDITPPLGTRKIGWLKVIVGDHVLDPLYARVCVLRREGGEPVAFVQLDTLSVSRRQVADVRQRVEAAHGVPGRNILVAATHNHAGPALVRAGEVKADPAYVESLTRKLLDAFAMAMASQEEVEIAFAHRHNHTLTNNRRVVLRDGTVRTHGTFDDPESLCLEGPVDPEVGVLAVRDKHAGRVIGCLVNYASHPAHHGGGTAFSAGWPGVFADEMKRAGVRFPMFVNGALGNVGTSDPRRNGADLSMEEMGRGLAAEVLRAIEGIATYGDDARLAARSEVVQLPFREPTEEQVKGTARGAQRFIDPAIYDRLMPELIEEIKTQGTQPAEVQAVFMGDHALVAIPAEFFVELGLRIKARCHPTRTLVYGLANGMVGYVPTAEAFAGGGYETTFLNTSKLAPQAGDLLAAAAVRLVEAGRA